MAHSLTASSYNAPLKGKLKTGTTKFISRLEVHVKIERFVHVKYQHDGKTEATKHVQDLIRQADASKLDITALSHVMQGNPHGLLAEPYCDTYHHSQLNFAKFQERAAAGTLRVEECMTAIRVMKNSLISHVRDCINGSNLIRPDSFFFHSVGSLIFSLLRVLSSFLCCFLF